MQRLATLSDDAVLHELHVIVGSHRRVTAELILHLGEVDARRLHVDKGFSSLFSYCVELLQFSEDEACRRIEAARLARRFPAIVPLLGTGTVSLTVLGLLKPHLTDDNHRDLLAGVSRSSVRRAKEWLATRFPQPDVPWSIRKRPGSRATGVLSRPATDGTSPVLARAATDGTSSVLARAATDETSSVSPRAVTDETSSVSPRAVTDETSQACFLAAPRAPAARSRVEPLSRDRFLVKFTASGGMREKLERACDLMRHANPDGELAIVLERAVDLLVAELEGKKQGQSRRPQKQPRAAKDSHVTRAARREVVGRDGWRCSFVANDGRRCNALTFLEFDHETPKGRGGESHAKNLRILCRSHNRWAAERAYGKEQVARAISTSRHRKRKGIHGATPRGRFRLRVTERGKILRLGGGRPSEDGSGATNHKPHVR